MYKTYSSYREIIDGSQQVNIPLIQLRIKKDDVESLYSGDIDYLIEPQRLNDFLKIVYEVCVKNCVSFMVCRKKYGKTQIFLYDDNDLCLQLEVWEHLEWTGIGSRHKQYALWEDIKKYCDSGRLRLDIEVLYYLSHLQVKSKSLESEEVQFRLEFYSAQLKKTVQYTYVRKLLDDLTIHRSINDVAGTSNLLLVKEGIFRDRGIIQNGKIFLLKKMHSLDYGILTNKKVIPVLGPDGVGKTTFIEGLRINYKNIKYFRFKKLFRKSLSYKLFYKFRKGSIEKKQGKKLEKNQFDDFYNLQVFIFSIYRYYYVYLKTFFDRKIYFFDRFFHDYCLKNVRFDVQTIIDNRTSTLMKLIPKPFWMVQLDAQTNTILRRKQELSFDGIEEYRKLIFEVYLTNYFTCYSYLSTESSLKRCMEILDKMNRQVKILQAIKD